MPGQANSYSCPENYSCFNGLKTPCPNGQVSAYGEDSCKTIESSTDCPAGFQPNNLISGKCDSCNVGQYSTTGLEDSCADCPAGSYCSTTFEAPILCPAGTYNPNTKQARCIKCPPGSFCSGTGNQAVSGTCTDLDGSATFSNRGATKCEDCPAGKACTVNGLIQDCPLGTFSNKNQSKCFACPAGKACPTPNQDPTTGNYDCQVGTYSVGLQNYCKPCPAGFSCTDTSSAPVICQVGQYSLEGETSCTDCKVRHQCPSIFSAEETLCPDGYYSEGNQNKCTYCPAGSFCTGGQKFDCTAPQWSINGAVSCSDCPIGYTCPNNSQPPIICRAGTRQHVSDQTQACQDCPEGTWCPSGSGPADGNHNYDGQIPNGFYVSAAAKGFTACPEGTFGKYDSNLKCLECPAGYFCPQATPLAGGPNTPVPPSEFLCLVGFYCPAGTGKMSDSAIKCGVNTYNPLRGGDGPSSCKTCPDGYYNEFEGQQYCLRCKYSHYCTGGIANACPNGKYTDQLGATSVNDCIDCPSGYKCDGASQPTSCPAGQFLTGGSTGSCQNCTAGQICSRPGLSDEPDLPCAAGHFCPLDSTTATDNPCPKGTYYDQTDAEVDTQCLACPEGFYCPVGTGGKDLRPRFCPIASYCPEGTADDTIQGCPAGTYSNKTRLKSDDECTECPKGYFCPISSSMYIDKPCPSGHYCPPGTESNNQFPCPAGTYMPNTLAEFIEDCLPCTRGSQCPTSGMDSPSDCGAGNYNPLLGQTGCTICEAGYYCPSATTVEQIEAKTGFYTDTGADAPISCDQNRFCPSNTTSQNTMNTDYLCPAGMYCPSGLGYKPNLEDNECPVNHYCQKGLSPVPCPAGTYTELGGLEQESECPDCPAGSYCPSSGSDIGFGSTTEQLICPSGYYCPLGSPTPTACNKGTYRRFTGAEDSDACAPCIAGFYCPIDAEDDPDLCPAGSYCTPGLVNPIDCPAGTFSNQTGLILEAQCTPCTAGMYCATPGLKEPTDDCDPGYYCTGKAVDPQQNDCPAGAYCPAGSYDPIPCDPGTFSTQTNQVNDNACGPCTPGNYCEGSLKGDVTGPCFEGYYCTGGASTPTQEKCPAGHACPEGADNPTPCSTGQFQPSGLKGVCLDCLPGYYCPTNSLGNTEGTVCPVGNYCPQGGSQQQQCPLGTYLDAQGRSSISECKPCLPGYACTTLGKTNVDLVNDICDAGYWCRGGSTTKTPTSLSIAASGFASGGGNCDPGYYCPAGTITPTENPCPLGTYNPNSNGKSLAACLPCDAGYACREYALTAATELCTAGYYCDGSVGSQMKSPLDKTYGDECPKGHYCPEGTGTPKPCKVNTFNPAYRQAECQDCPAGYDCNVEGIGAIYNTTNINGILITSSIFYCPKGYYCPEGQGSQACPQNTYRDALRGEKVEDCYTCPRGKLCPAGSGDPNLAPVTDCPAGSYCVDGIAGDCPLGNYCPEGTLFPQPCAPGSYLDSSVSSPENQNDCLPCTAGKYCPFYGQSQVEGDCQPGYACPLGSSSPTQEICAPGTFSSGGLGSCQDCDVGEYSSSGSSSCLSCPPGFYQNVTGQANCLSCPPGNFCPDGSNNPTPCAAGSGTGSGIQFSSQDDCDKNLCPPGKYCINGVVIDDCDAGFYCGGGSGSAQPVNDTRNGPCPVGFYCPKGSANPLGCPPGYYCPSQQMDENDYLTNLCKAGYSCSGAAINPCGGTDAINNPDAIDCITCNECPAINKCQPGYYCNEGSTKPTGEPCPSGTYNKFFGRKVLKSCLDCDPGFYCPDKALVDQVPCQAGYYCPNSTMVETTEYFCPIGSKCPEGSEQPIFCEAGQQQPKPTQSDCEVCSAGFYCNGIDQRQICPLGQICPEGTINPGNCPNGEYSTIYQARDNSSCINCPIGYYCPEDQPGAISCTGDQFYCSGNCGDQTCGNNLCPAGSECNNGIAQKCPPGTFKSNTGSGSCQNCTAGYACPYVGSTTGEFVQCSEGFYCEEGSYSTRQYLVEEMYFWNNGLQEPCPTGETTLNKGQLKCISCPEYYQCVTENGVPSKSECPRGYYCPGGVGNNPTPCPINTYGWDYNPGKDDSTCLDCIDGQLCDQQGMNYTEMMNSLCPAGSYCQVRPGVVTVENDCPQGFYCPEGTPSPHNKPCPIGTYNNQTRLESVDQCQNCPAGYYCPYLALIEPVLCKAGFYCPGDGTTSFDEDDMYSNPCPPGSQCPVGSKQPENCPINTYGNQEYLENCLPCPAGYTCANLGTRVPVACPSGQYCEEGSPPQNCPIGTWQPYQGGSSIEDCLCCPAGYICDTAGLNDYSSMTTTCQAGFYCNQGSIDDTGTTYTKPDGSKCSDQTGLCPEGFYCPGGLGRIAAGPLECQAGYLCNSQGLSDPTDSDLCPAGYYCPGGGSDPIQIECPKDYYCPEGSINFKQCPSGSLGTSSSGSEKLEDCLTCTGGFYCQIDDNTGSIIQQPCDPGYYCEDDSYNYSPTQNICPPGYKCPSTNSAGTATPEPCIGTSYQNNYGSTSCKNCPAGYMCECDTNCAATNNDTLQAASTNFVQCELGYYCEQGKEKVKCPVGTYGQVSGLGDVSMCSACLNGYYCDEEGMTPANFVDNSKICPAGQFCFANENTGLGASSNIAGENPCPSGSYCPEGIIVPSRCPPGSYADADSTGTRQTSDDCVPCPEGKGCPYTGMNSQDVFSGQIDLTCVAGFVCPQGSKSQREEVCPEGYTCPAGSATPGACSAGTYILGENNNQTVADGCLPCPASKICDGSPFGPVNCKPGFYCPLTGSPEPCPAGTYSDLNNGDLKSADDCLVCPPGYFCDGSDPTSFQICPGGYYCPAGLTNGQANPCTAGNYCPEGSESEVPCPLGTFNINSGSSDLTDCISCRAKNYCDPSDRKSENLCSAGWYCPGSNYQAQSEICDTGSECGIGSDVSTDCSPGTYQPAYGSIGSCLTCEPGTSCSDPKSSNITECDIGEYCPDGINIFQCNISYYGTGVHQSSETDGCSICPAGSFCDTPGQKEPNYRCDARYYCPNGSDNVQKVDCPAGYYCPANSTYPTICDEGSYCETDLLDSPTGPCSAGFYCPSGATNSTFISCPQGFYCPSDQQSQGTLPLACPIGTYQNQTERTSLADCLPCPVDQFCQEPALISPNDFCKEGYYCNANSTTAYENECPVGSFCQGNQTQEVCPEGFYTNINRQSICQSCPPGHYCSNGIINECPKGSFCVGQVNITSPCPAGTFSNRTQLQSSDECQQCPIGSYCSGGQSDIDGQCDPGYFCPETSDNAQQELCPPGYYCQNGLKIACLPGYFSNTTAVKPDNSTCLPCSEGFSCPLSANVADQYMDCPKGFFCSSGNSNPTDPNNICPLGHYCPVQTATPFACPKGTYLDYTGAISPNLCKLCPGGYYCDLEGTTSYLGNICDAGYYCLSGAENSTQNICEAGYYCPQQSTIQIACQPGTYQDQEGQDNCLDCGVGQYCPDVAMTKSLACPSGSYCDSTTTTLPKNCAAGTFNPNVNSTDVSACQSCTAGSYCQSPGLSSPTNICDAGFYCETGSVSSTGSKTTNSITSIDQESFCCAGFYCPSNSSEPIACPPKTFSGVAKKDSCDPCPEGYYCDGTPENSERCLAYTSGTIVPKICPAGSYCTGGEEFSCDIGFYNPLQKMNDSSACLPCIAGQACTQTGLPSPNEGCDPGYFCPTGSNSTQMESCESGFYCPENSTQMLICPGGQACTTDNLASPDQNCTAGFFCPPGGQDSQAQDCPPGHFCPESSSIPTPCNPGTNSTRLNAISNSTCENCPGGYYCDVFGIGSADKICPAGYYCPEGSVAAKINICPTGYFCQEQSEKPMVCVNGTYTSEPGQDSCKICTDGYQCYSVEDQVTNELIPIVSLCPTGKYCNNGTVNDCPIGTFSTIEGLVLESKCTKCLPGKLCPTPGLNNQDDLQDCPAGSYCSSGNQIPCPLGSYCEEATAMPTGCSPGTYGNATGLQTQSECKTCDPGKYCPKVGGIWSDQVDCLEGYFCDGTQQVTNGSSSSDPNFGSSNGAEYYCEAGHFCPPGSEESVKCLDGTYQNAENQGTCDPCPAGFECRDTEGTVEPEICTAGHYCPGGTRQNCPAGTYRNNYGTINSTDCNPCLAGFYCPNDETVYPTLECDAGYFCDSGAINSTQNDCTPGSYCEQGTGTPVGCPPGTFSNFTNLVGPGPISESSGLTNQCLSCTGGMFCDVSGETEPAGNCSAKYYCPEGSSSQTEILCEALSYCPQGSAEPQSCQDGQYQPLIGQDSCILCQAGYYCFSQDNAATDDNCNQGNLKCECEATEYCEAGTSGQSGPNPPKKCGPGRYSVETLNQKNSDCDACPENKYCENGQISTTNAGDCQEGYYCLSGAASATPQSYSCDDLACNGPCPPGRYCAAGNDYGVCPDGTYGSVEIITNSTTNITSFERVENGPGTKQQTCTGCLPGFTCNLGRTYPEDCQPGSYCIGPLNSPTGDQDVTQCEAGKYNPDFQSTSENSCLLCDPGNFCEQIGIGDQDSFPCPRGFGCPGGNQDPFACSTGENQNMTGQANCDPCTPGFYCPEVDISTTDDRNIEGTPCQIGYECPEGSSEQQVCAPGRFCPETEMPVGFNCTAGYYCPGGTINPIVCSYPAYCPEGSSSETPCPAGYFPSSQTNLRSELDSSCTLCDPGYYRNSKCDQSTCIETCDICPENYYCPYNYITPEDLPIPCPAGNECPEGSDAPDPCAAGTYGYVNIKDGEDFSTCVPCPENTYNNILGQTKCFPCGSVAVSEPGQALCSCLGDNRAFQPSDGACICDTGYIYYSPLDISIDASDINSDQGCIAIANEPCTNGAVRDQSTRQCLDNSDNSCTGPCGESGGVFQVSLGTCICNDNTVPEENPCALDINISQTNSSIVCYSISLKIDDNGYIVKTYNDPAGNELSSEYLNNTLYGPSRYAMEQANQNFEVIFGADTIAAVLPDPEKFSTSSRRRRSTYPLEISNPILCLNEGDSITFMAVNDHYPVYIRNDLRNSRPNFDSGNFRNLANSEYSNLIFAFTEYGTFIFSDNIDTSRQMIVSVMEPGVDCPADQSRIQPQTSASLARNGVGQVDQVSLQPDWSLIIGIVAGVSVALLIFLCVVCYCQRNRNILNLLPVQLWRPNYYKTSEEYQPPWYFKDKLDASRKEIKELRDEIEEIEGTKISGNSQEEGSERSQNNATIDKMTKTKEAIKLIFNKPDGYSENNDLLQDINIKTIVDKMEDQSLHVGNQLTHEKQLMENFVQDYLKSTNGLAQSKLDLDQLNAKALKNKKLAKQKLDKNDSKSTWRNDDTSDSEHSSDDEDDENKLQNDQEIIEQLEKEVSELLQNFKEQFSRGEIILSADAIEKLIKQLGFIKESQQKPSKLANLQGSGKKKSDHLSNLDPQQILSEQQDEINDLAQKMTIDNTKTLMRKMDDLDNNFNNTINAIEINDANNKEGNNTALDSILDEYADNLLAASQNQILNREAQLQRLKDKLEAQRLNRLNKLQRKQAQQINKYNAVKGSGTGGIAERLAGPGTINTLNISQPNAKLNRDLTTIFKDLEAARNTINERNQQNQEQVAKTSKDIDDMFKNFISNAVENEKIGKNAVDRLTKDLDNVDQAVKRSRNKQLDKLRERMLGKAGKKKRSASSATEAEDDDDEHSDIEDLDHLSPEEHNLNQIEAKLEATTRELAETQKLNILKNFIKNNDKSIPKADQMLNDFNKKLADLQNQRNQKHAELRNDLLRRKNQKDKEHLTTVSRSMNQALTENTDGIGNDNDPNNNQDLARELKSSKLVSTLENSDQYQSLDKKLKDEKENLSNQLEIDKIKDLENFHLNKTQKDDQELAEFDQIYDLKNASKDIIEKHAKERQELINKQKTERSQQANNLQEKLRLRKERLMKSKKLDISSNLASEKSELAKNLLEKDNSDGFTYDQGRLVSKITNLGENSTISLDDIHNLVNQRHEQEISKIKKMQPLKYDAYYQKSLLDLDQEFAEKEERLEENLEKDLNEAKNPDEVLEIENEFRQRLKLIKNKKQGRLKQLKEAAETNAKLDTTQEIIDLKNKHYQEINQLMNKLPASIQENLARTSDADATANQAKQQNVENLQKRLADQKAKQQAEFQEKLKQLETEENERVAREMAQFEVELEEAENKLKTEAKEKLQKLTRDNQNFVHKQEIKLEANIKEIREKAENQGKSEAEINEEIDQLMNNHNKNMLNYSKNLELNREKIQEQLNSRLRNRKLKRTTDKMNELDAQTNQQIQALQQEHAKEVKKLIENANEVAEIGEEDSSGKHEAISAVKPKKLVDQEETELKKSEAEDKKDGGIDYSGLLSNLTNIKRTLDKYDPSELAKISQKLAEKPKVSSAEGLSFSSSSPEAISNFPSIPDFKPQAINPKLIESDPELSQKYSFLSYLSKLLYTTEHNKFKKLITVLLCSNNDLPGLPKYSIDKGYYFDEINAILWVEIGKLRREQINQMSLDFVKIVALVNEQPYSEGLTVLSRNMFESRILNSFGDHLDLNLF